MHRVRTAWSGRVLAGGRASYTVSRLLQHDNVAPQVRTNAELLGDMTLVVTESFAGTGIFAAKVVDVCAEVSRICKSKLLWYCIALGTAVKPQQKRC